MKSLMSAAEAAGYAMAAYSADELPEEQLPETTARAALPRPQLPVALKASREIEESLSAQALIWGAWLRDWLICHFSGRAAA
jgi:hypothetical protein